MTLIVVAFGTYVQTADFSRVEGTGWRKMLPDRHIAVTGCCFCS